jgi:SAM-dependent methyltransferase
MTQRPDPQPPKPLKSLLIWRVGGVGDLLWCSAALPVLRRQGWTIDFCTDARGRAVLVHNPHIRTIIDWETERDPDGKSMNDPEGNRLVPERVKRWIEAKQSSYTRIHALTWTVEGVSLWRTSDHRAEYNLPLAERQSDMHYTDEMVRRLAMPWLGGLLPQLYPSRAERRWLDDLRARHVAQKQQILLWHIGGSAYNKVLPQAIEYVGGLLDNIPTLAIYLLGDERLIAFEQAAAALPDSSRARCISTRPVAQSVGATHASPVSSIAHDPWTLRQQLLAPSIADCVVGPESAITNAAACWDVPKVVFYSHSRHENLSLYWWNTYPIYPTPACACAPCYRIVEAEPEDCKVYEADLGWKPGGTEHSAQSTAEPWSALCPEPCAVSSVPCAPCPVPDRGRPVGAKCCVHLDHANVFSVIGTILHGRKDRTCPVCGKQKNRILEPGLYICICGAHFGLPQPSPRPRVEPVAMVCPICQTHTFARQAIGWARCVNPQCSVIFQDPRHLDPSVYDADYEKKYDHPQIRAKIRAVGERWIPTVELLLGSTAPRLLEIGPLLGEVLTYARSRGWDAWGNDINPIATDPQTIVGNFETVDFGARTFDFVFSNHVFEHFLDPLAALAKMVAITTPGGYILIATPDANHQHVAAHFHRKEHHVLFTEAALRAAALQLGLEVIELEHHDGPECGLVSWFDFHVLLRTPAAQCTAHSAQGGPDSEPYALCAVPCAGA